MPFPYSIHELEDILILPMRKLWLLSDLSYQSQGQDCFSLRLHHFSLRLLQPPPACGLTSFQSTFHSNATAIFESTIHIYRFSA